MTSINLLFTQSINGVIGRENEILWYLNKELFDFREKTKGQISSFTEITMKAFVMLHYPTTNRRDKHSLQITEIAK